MTQMASRNIPARNSDAGMARRRRKRAVPWWIAAARPRTLGASLVPVAVGTGAAQEFIAWRFFAALAVAIGGQVAVNYANDAFDARHGVDTAERVGPRRLTASGAVSQRAMFTAMFVAGTIGSLAGFALAAAAGWWLIAVGAACIIAGLTYSGGPRPYGAAGLGEAAVFVFFGLVATAGSAYVQVERIVPVSVAAAVPVGLLAVAILMVNNLRDISTDERAGKRTLAVKLGPERARLTYVGAVAVAFAAVVPTAVYARSFWPLLAYTALFVAPAPLIFISRHDPASQAQALTGTAGLHMIMGALLALGLWLA